ncbi:MAG: flippase-like domain-containing protein [Lachnospiraceae bacterium]|nr:flippase-like domain-containing protein [Lachnospiraceae bacterium]
MIFFKILLGGALCIVWFLVIHTIKMFRMYLVLLEHRIEFKKFVFAYLGTTLVNLIIPFKLGEVFRMFAYSKLTKNAGTGIAGTLVDRFFDTMALVLILIPLHVLHPDKISAVSVFLTVFVIFTVFVYLIFMPAYSYLNRYIIINRDSRNSMAVLRFLEIIKSAFDYVKRLTSGRYALIILMSFAAWVLEGGLLLVLAKLIGVPYDAGVFSDYITSIMSSARSVLQEKYTLYSIVVIAICTIVQGLTQGTFPCVRGLFGRNK